jgi:Asp-tRNA(Asn)/Glu-tRNA(Gln) amidotransferase A subunit family amidase
LYALAGFNLSQPPALVLPCGQSTGGLPIALQRVAPHHEQAVCIKAGAAYEAATHWHRLRARC